MNPDSTTNADNAAVETVDEGQSAIGADGVSSADDAKQAVIFAESTEEQCAAAARATDEGRFAEVSDTLRRIEETFQARIRVDETKNGIIDALQAEVREHRQGVIATALKPILRDLIRMTDDLTQLSRAFRAVEQPDPNQLLKILDELPADLESVLNRYGVTPFTSEREEFDPKSQQALKRVPTDDPALNQRIAERLRAGYRMDERILRPEMVAIFVHNAALLKPLV